MVQPPEQDELDVRLARAVYGRVARRWCAPDPDSDRWEVRRPRSVDGDVWRPTDGHALLWCYPVADWRDWATVPAFGQDGGAMLAALTVYVDAHGYGLRINHDMGLWNISLAYGAPWAAWAKGSTFALAARAAILAMEDER